MNDGELAQCYAALGVQPGVSLEELERVFMKRNFSLLKGRSGAADEANPELDRQRQVLRGAYEQIAEHLRGQQKVTAARKRPQLLEVHPPRPPASSATLLAPPPVPVRGEPDDFALFAFDNWKVNTFVPPLLLGLVFLANLSPLKFLLVGFQVWMHEFGHATAAWLTGRRATPLPFGWTPIAPEYSPFVYWGLLLMFALLFLAGLKERKVWPMLVAVALASLQFHMTWIMPGHRQEFWWNFGGLGGEFYLSTLFMVFYFVQLPEKFKWGACRYIFFLIGATAFLHIWWFWRDVYRGLEEIPFGTMINGEDDQGGDMNKLMDGYGWTKFMIRRNYHLIGNGCWIALGLVWAAFVLRLNKVADWVAGRFSRPAEEVGES